MPHRALARTTTRFGLAAKVLLVAAWGGSCAGEGPPGPRNAILISIDTLRPDFLSCYGHGRPTSPNLDALAARGVRFADVTAAAPWTLPSHATMLTGLYPSHHGAKDHETRLPDSVETVAEVFRAAGFETLAVVNTHNLGAPEFQLLQGFERFEYVEEVDRTGGRLRTPNMGPQVLAATKKLFAERRDAPFFLFLHFYDVHTDFTPDEESRARFVQPYGGKITGRSPQLNGMRNRGARLKEPDLVFLKEMYEAEIRTFDRLFGEFVAWLSSEGFLDETLIVITSDHGEEFQEHGGLLHGRTQYQEVLRVPLILAGPGVPAGVVVDQPVHGVDVAPTLLARCGLAPARPVDGIDLAPAWRGEMLPERLFFAEADHNNQVDGRPALDIKKMVRRGTSKLLLDTHSGAVELYDLAQDPGELADLAPTAEARASELRAELERFLEGAVQGEVVAPPTPEQQSVLDALGYGGGIEEE
jgi:arylsulfatase A-like enzyme